MSSTKIIQARTEMISATNYIMRNFELSSVEMDGILSSLLADIRAQTSAELVRSMTAPPEEQRGENEDE